MHKLDARYSLIEGIEVAHITIRGLDDDVISKLQVRAAERRWSMAEEVRKILHDAVADMPDTPQNLLDWTRECFAPFGDVELELPERGPMRDPPDFS